MTDQKNIETGVDKLVDLINHKKKISTADAAKEMGVSIPVIQEWAEFLEDEGIITIEYKLSRTYLCERQLSRPEVEKKATEYTAKKDAFTGRVEAAISSLRKEAEGFEQIKEEFKKLKEMIGGDIDQVREELQELRHYEDLKKNIDKDIIQQRLDYQDMLAQVHRQIGEERKKYEHYIDDINSEAARIEESKVELNYLEKKSDTLKKRIDAQKEVMVSILKKIDEEKGMIRASVDKINSDLISAEKIKKEIEFKMNTELAPVIRSTKEREEKILTVQDSILKKIMEKKREIDKYSMESTAAADKFKSFFDRTVKADELMIAMGKEKIELEKEMEGLIVKAKSFNLAAKSADVKNYIKDLEKSLDSAEKKKFSFIERLKQLADIVSNK